MRFILSAIASVFLFIAAVYLVFGIINAIKQGRYIGQDVEGRSAITVSESGEVYANPDLAIVDLSVISEDKTVAEAMSNNTGKMDQIVALIKNQGVEAKDIKTTDFSIYPRYEYNVGGGDKRILVGYEVQQTLQVKIRDLQKTSSIIQAATNAGVNQVGNLQFTIDQQDELRKQAREIAIEKAKAKAQELARQLGVKLTRITSFSEGFNDASPIYKEMAYSMGGGASSIESGQNKIEVSVNITYEIN